MSNNYGTIRRGTQSKYFPTPYLPKSSKKVYIENVNSEKRLLLNSTGKCGNHNKEATL
jgi:hypothetical protein